MSKLNNWFIKNKKSRVYLEGGKTSLNYLQGGINLDDKECGLCFGWEYTETMDFTYLILMMDLKMDQVIVLYHMMVLKTVAVAVKDNNLI